MKTDGRSDAQQFLRKHHMHPDDILFEACAAESEADMLAGLAGRPVSFEMLPCYLSMQQDLPPVEKDILVLDAGGTNLRLATVHSRGAYDLDIAIRTKQLMPGVERPVDADEMFDALARSAMPILPGMDCIGFCFSYAMDMQEDRDGKIRFICKSIRIDNAPGRLVGAGLNQGIVRHGGREMETAVVNDAVAVALAAQSNHTEYSAYIGMIVGTGFNICYAERTDQIAGAAAYHSPDMLINLESDKFFKMRRGTFDREYETVTGDNDHPTMKMLTGAYLGGLCYLTFLGAARERLVSEETGAALEELGALTTECLCQFLGDPRGDSPVALCCRTASDADCLAELALLLIERGSKLVAAILRAVIHRSYRYRGDRPVCICVEGSTIQKVPTMKEKICAYLAAHTDPVHERFEMISLEHATIRGAAIAALQHRA